MGHKIKISWAPCALKTTLVVPVHGWTWRVQILWVCAWQTEGAQFIRCKILKGWSTTLFKRRTATWLANKVGVPARYLDDDRQWWLTVFKLFLGETFRKTDKFSSSTELTDMFFKEVKKLLVEYTDRSATEDVGDVRAWEMLQIQPWTNWLQQHMLSKHTSVDSFFCSCLFLLSLALSRIIAITPWTHPSARSSFYHSWQFEHTVFKIGLKYWSDFPNYQKILPWDLHCRKAVKVYHVFFILYSQLSDATFKCYI